MKLKLYIVLAVFILALAACDNTTNPGPGLTPEEQQANQEDFGSANAAVTTETLQAFTTNNHMDTAGNYVITVTGTQTIDKAITLADGVKVSLRGSGTVKLDVPVDNIGVCIMVDSGASLAIRGPTLQLAASKTGCLVWVMAGGSLALQSGTVKGHDNNDVVAVWIASGTFTMNGGTISGNTDGGGGVSVSGGTFTMNGGTISGNTDGGGVSVFWGTFTMNGGTISGNTGGRGGGGGGVYVYNGTFTMSGGTISGNTTTSEGGGVFVLDGTFTKTGGIIYGKGAGANSNTAGADTKGHAVYYSKDNTGLNVKYRDTTLGKDGNISTTDLTSGWTP